MKSKLAVILLAVFLCLTTGCNNAPHIAETPDPISSSDSNIVPSESETAQAEKKTEVDRPQSTESQTDNRAAEFPASVSESDTQTTEVPDQADHSIGDVRICRIAIESRLYVPFQIDTSCIRINGVVPIILITAVLGGMMSCII